VDFILFTTSWTWRTDWAWEQ